MEQERRPEEVTSNFADHNETIPNEAVPSAASPIDVQKELEEYNREFEQMDLSVFQEKMTAAVQASGLPTKETVEALLMGSANKGIMPKQALNLGDDTMEAIYSQGYTLYNQGRYKEASYVFRLLMLLDYLTPKYILGLAASLHRMKDYKNAANIYLLCGTLDTTNPLPHYHAADCYLQLDIPELALFSLGLAISAAAEQPQYAVIKERAALMKEALEKQMKEQGEEQEHVQKAGPSAQAPTPAPTS